MVSAISLWLSRALTFNKPGKLIQSDFSFDDRCLENVRHYQYLVVYISANGKFNYGQDDFFKKSISFL